MMACTIKEFIICPRIITFHVIQKSSVQTGIYKSWALSRATDSLSMWPVHLQRELAERARGLRVCSPAPSLKRVMNHRKNQKKEIRSWTGWVWRKQDFCWRPQTGQERMSRGCTVWSTMKTAQKRYQQLTVTQAPRLLERFIPGKTLELLNCPDFLL